jgi:hypothetical protein
MEIYKETIKKVYEDYYEKGYFTNYEGKSLKQIMSMTHMEIFKEDIFRNGSNYVM